MACDRHIGIWDPQAHDKPVKSIFSIIGRKVRDGSLPCVDISSISLSRDRKGGGTRHLTRSG